MALVLLSALPTKSLTRTGHLLSARESGGARPLGKCQMLDRIHMSKISRKLHLIMATVTDKQGGT